MSEREVKFDLESLKAATLEVEPKVWEAISSAAPAIGRNSVGPIGGYNIIRQGISKFSPRIGIRAEFEVNQEGIANPQAAILFVLGVAENLSEGEHRLLVEYLENYPMMRVILRDPVFGRNPKIPNRIDFRIYYDPSAFIIRT